jgi:hypothetical protein
MKVNRAIFDFLDPNLMVLPKKEGVREHGFNWPPNPL